MVGVNENPKSSAMIANPPMIVESWTKKGLKKTIGTALIRFQFLLLIIS
jgi:hypothetical protein